MKNFFMKISYGLQKFMRGRYGVDALSRFLTLAGVISLLTANFKPFRFMMIVGLILLLWAIFRAYSRNYNKRSRELHKFQKMTEKPKKLFSLSKNMWRDRKTHRYLKCKNCGAVLRVPKNRGKIEITCPQCHGKTIRKT